jgi:DNA-binding transcriptional LysR family regulator
MTLEQLRIFVAVAEREHVTRAAESLNLSQSALSAAISNVEGRYGVELFRRVGRRIALTEEGRLFLSEAKAVLARVAEAEHVLEELSGLKRGRLAIHASQTIASYWLPLRLAAYRKAYPQVDVKLLAGNTQQVAKAVLEGGAEIGFVEGQIDNTAFDITCVGSDRLVVVVAADHPWAKLRRVQSKDLSSGEWVLRELGSGTRSEFESALLVRGIDVGQLKVALELPSNEAVCVAVQSGIGATAISELAVSAELRSGVLVRVAIRLPEREFHSVRLRGRYYSRAAQAFMAMAMKSYSATV